MNGVIIPDNKISKYLNDEFFYYNNIYENICNFGLHCKWTDSPSWVLDLYYLFKQVDKNFEIHQLNKQYKH
jgi:hypothetical protein